MSVHSVRLLDVGKLVRFLWFAYCPTIRIICYVQVAKIMLLHLHTDKETHVIF